VPIFVNAIHSTDAAVNQTAAPSTQASPNHLEGLIIEGNSKRREQRVSGIDKDVPFLQFDHLSHHHIKPNRVM
jgi:hypothetical protein